jgi:2-hydroxychromene-2-carboxylate isomerase
MGEVVMLREWAANWQSIGGSRSAFFFDLACPFSYLTAERVERAIGDVDWVPCALPAAPRFQLTTDVIGRAERQAFALQLPLIWPEGFPRAVSAAQRAASYAAEVGAGARFALAASRLAFCGGYDLEDREILADAAAAAGVAVDQCLRAADDPARDQRLAQTARRLRSCGVPRLPAIRIGRRWLWGEQMLNEARPLLRNAAS